jgi:hypothetical protein
VPHRFARPGWVTERPGWQSGPVTKTRWTMLTRVGLVVLVLGLAAMWAYAFFGDPGVPGRMDDATFAAGAEPVCHAVQDRIRQLPPAHQTTTPDARAEVVDQATAYLETMVGDLRAQIPAAAPQHDMVSQWLDDWATYVKDRRAYTVELRTNPQVRFAVTLNERDQTQITKAIDHFAAVNTMASCATPDDVG